MAKRKPIERPAPSAPEYPRPLLQRGNWQSLDGEWDFAFDPDDSMRTPAEVDWKKTIIVPFAPETKMSGLAVEGFFEACWYRRWIQIKPPAVRQRVILHFSAVDWEAHVWVNGQFAVRHEGGYTPFKCDITDLLVDGDDQEIVLRACDDPHDLAKPRGKQDWREAPHSIWYERTSGIWQTVWLETVPESHISALRWTPDMPSWSIRLNLKIAGPRRSDLSASVKLSLNGRPLSDDVYALITGELDRTINLPDPGIEDERSSLLWQPGRPNLIDAEITLLDRAGKIIDEITSYTAMRSVWIDGDRFVLNGRRTTLQLVLDQGYWPDSGLTAPDDNAIRRDVELALAMGFNGVRKHQKIEQPRFLYWADKLGLLVWEELPSAYRFCDESVHRLMSTWIETIERDVNHPCIIAWVPINESWGVPDLPKVPQQRDLLRALYATTKTLDPTRPVISNDGWESGPTDMVTIHDYESDTDKLAARYTLDARNYLLEQVQPANRRLLLEEHPYNGQPIVLSEFGGIAFSKDTAHTWGYSRVASADDLSARYAELLQTIRALPLFMGFCYTQFTDTYQEANGLLYMDRTPKFPLEEIAIATRGARNDAERKIEAKWAKRNS